MIVLIFAVCAANFTATFFLLFSYCMDDSKFKKGLDKGRKEGYDKGYSEGFNKALDFNNSDYETGYIIGKCDAMKEFKEQQKNNQQ